MNRTTAIVLTALLIATSLGWKKHQCCQHCGCQCPTVKVCHVVVETKKVPKVCYGCECEDVCVPGPSCLCGEHCACKEDPCRPGCFSKKTVLDWIPGCAYVKTRAKLTKKEVEVEQKTYKWVIEELCPHCAAGCREKAEQEVPASDAPAPEAIPAPPAPSPPAAEKTAGIPAPRR